MEASSLIKAHDHARAASVATHGQTADPTVASNEHALAAGEFANAAQSTASIEALRTLRLLEQHHQRLAELLKLSPSASSSIDDDEKAAAAANDGSAPDPHAKTELGGTTAQKILAGVPSLAQQRRYPSRDLTSSIASNLASARGIRSKYRVQPLTPSVSNTEAPGNVEVRPRREGSRSNMQDMLDHAQSGKPAWVPPAHPSSREDAPKKVADAPTQSDDTAVAAEEGYSRFYNTFGSLINRLSAPLAFAGLPLIAEESMTESTEAPEPPPVKRPRTRTPQTVSVEPDWSKNFSRATLQALSRDGHTANDSFYVVPKSGHTMSYANILSFAEKEKRRMGASQHGDALDEDDEDFVDARETPAPLSPGARRKVGKMRTDKDMANTIEELYTENKSLKDMLDKLSKRLHAFEASAQNSSLALAESMRLMRPGSPLSTGAGSGHRAASSDETQALRKKNEELEEQLALAMTQMEGLDRERRKVEKILAKYREKWEKLKAGAKARREAQGVIESVEEESGPS